MSPTCEQDPLNIIVCGTGGQGNLLVSRLLANAMGKKGYQAIIGETFGMSQRGGNVMSHVRLSRQKTWGPLIPEGQAHLVLSLEPMETVRVLGDYGNPKVEVVSNIRPVHPMAAITGESQYPDLKEVERAIRELSARCWLLDATQLALDLGDPILSNIIMMGALIKTGALDLDLRDIKEILGQSFSDQVLQTNLKAAALGMAAVRVENELPLKS